MFENTALAVAQQVGIEGAYFDFNTMWIPLFTTTFGSLAKLQEVFPDSIINIAGDEYAVDFVGPGEGKIFAKLVA
jgi:hypothetical protein